MRLLQLDAQLMDYLDEYLIVKVTIYFLKFNGAKEFFRQLERHFEACIVDKQDLWAAYSDYFYLIYFDEKVNYKRDFFGLV